MIPMGTIVTCCMFAGVLTAAPFELNQKLPSPLAKGVGFILLAAGLWNVLWYSIQHLTEFWRLAALGSGILMIITAIFILDHSRLPQWLIKRKPLVLFGLLGFGLTYATKIASL